MTQDARWRSSLSTMVFRVLGFVFLGLGMLGLFLPILPTTIFLIVAVLCFARSSPKLMRRLLRDERFGPALRNWFGRGAISRGGKAGAITGMSLGFAILWLVSDQFWLILGGVAVLLVSAAFILTRPSA